MLMCAWLMAGNALGTLAISNYKLIAFVFRKKLAESRN